jgi:mono/diheme cytochrome c family protein
MLHRKLSLAILTVAFGWLICMTFYPPASGAEQNESDEKKQILEGREVFLHLCASCHGVDAKGRGPVASSLKKHPGDLTRISIKYGKFPTAKIRAVIIGDPLLPVHGPKQMPVWGGILKDPELANLLKYLESLQRLSETVPISLIVK